MIVNFWAPTATRCPLDSELTTIDKTILADPITTNYGTWSTTEPAQNLGFILGCGHILATGRWTFRFAADEDRVYWGWWTQYGDSNWTPPADAVRCARPEPTP